MDDSMKWAKITGDIISKEFLIVVDQEMSQSFNRDSRIKAASSKTGCCVELTQRFVRKRAGLYKEQKQFVLRISGPDEHSIEKCNKLIESIYPSYSQRKAYTRKKHPKRKGTRQNDIAFVTRQEIHQELIAEPCATSTFKSPDSLSINVAEAINRSHERNAEVHTHEKSHTYTHPKGDIANIAVIDDEVFGDLKQPLEWEYCDEEKGTSERYRQAYQCIPTFGDSYCSGFTWSIMHTKDDLSKEQFIECYDEFSEDKRLVSCFRTEENQFFSVLDKSRSKNINQKINSENGEQTVENSAKSEPAQNSNINNSFDGLHESNLNLQSAWKDLFLKSKSSNSSQHVTNENDSNPMMISASNKRKENNKNIKQHFSRMRKGATDGARVNLKKQNERPSENIQNDKTCDPERQTTEKTGCQISSIKNSNNDSKSNSKKTAKPTKNSNQPSDTKSNKFEENINSETPLTDKRKGKRKKRKLRKVKDSSIVESQENEQRSSNYTKKEKEEISRQVTEVEVNKLLSKIYSNLHKKHYENDWKVSNCKWVETTQENYSNPSSHAFLPFTRSARSSTDRSPTLQNTKQSCEQMSYFEQDEELETQKQLQLQNTMQHNSGSEMRHPYMEGISSNPRSVDSKMLYASSDPYQMQPPNPQVLLIPQICTRCQDDINDPNESEEFLEKRNQRSSKGHRPTRRRRSPKRRHHRSHHTRRRSSSGCNGRCHSNQRDRTHGDYADFADVVKSSSDSKYGVNQYHPNIIIIPINSSDGKELPASATKYLPGPIHRDLDQLGNEKRSETRSESKSRYYDSSPGQAESSSRSPSRRSPLLRKLSNIEHRIDRLIFLKNAAMTSKPQSPRSKDNQSTAISSSKDKFKTASKSRADDKTISKSSCINTLSKSQQPLDDKIESQAHSEILQESDEKSESESQEQSGSSHESKEKSKSESQEQSGSLHESNEKSKSESQEQSGSLHESNEKSKSESQGLSGSSDESDAEQQIENVRSEATKTCDGKISESELSKTPKIIKISNASYPKSDTIISMKSPSTSKVKSSNKSTKSIKKDQSKLTDPTEYSLDSLDVVYGTVSVVEISDPIQSTRDHIYRSTSPPKADEREAYKNRIGFLADEEQPLMKSNLSIKHETPQSFLSINLSSNSVKPFLNFSNDNEIIMDKNSDDIGGTSKSALNMLRSTKKPKLFKYNKNKSKKMEESGENEDFITIDPTIFNNQNEQFMELLERLDGHSPDYTLSSSEIMYGYEPKPSSNSPTLQASQDDQNKEIIHGRDQTTDLSDSESVTKRVNRLRRHISRLVSL